jgi:hypothetical protein
LPPELLKKKGWEEGAWPSSGAIEKNQKVPMLTDSEEEEKEKPLEEQKMNRS